jgi:hypothetical protein
MKKRTMGGSKGMKGQWEEQRNGRILIKVVLH